MHMQNTDKKPRVILLGTSVLMESVANSLSQRDNLEVIHTEQPPSEPSPSVPESKPDMIIFELDPTQPYPMLSMVGDHSDVLFLGLDLTSCKVVVLNTRLHLTHTMDELYKTVIEELNV